jgi:hypothetical protein
MYFHIFITFYSLNAYINIMIMYFHSFSFNWYVMTLWQILNTLQYMLIRIDFKGGLGMMRISLFLFSL